MARQQLIADSWEQGNAYEQYVGRWSRKVAPLFLSWMDVPSGLNWLDVGCGTGALSSAIADLCKPGSIAGVEPSEGFLETAKAHLKVKGRVDLHLGTATELPLAGNSVDVVVSGLVLNFVTGPGAALAEMRRVTRNQGTIAAYVWDYAGRMDLMRFFWDAAVELDPDALLIDEGVRFPMCRPEALEQLFRSAGLTNVQVAPLQVQTLFHSFDDYWQPFLGGQGPAPAYVKSLSETARTRLRDRLHERLPIESDGSISLIARAWAVRGTVAR